MKLRTMAMLGGQALRSLRKTPALTSVMVVMACMAAVSVFAVFAVNLTAIGRQLQSQVQIRVFIDQSVVPDGKESLGRSIKALPGVTKVAYVSKDEALRRLGLQMGETGFFLSDLERNPLPDSFDVSVARADDARAVADGIWKLDGVSDVIYGQKWVDNLVGALRVLWGVTGIVACLALVGASLIVSNTIRLSVFARRKEIEIMKLVGATDGFILFPFVIEGLIIGIGGSCAATGLVAAGYLGLVTWMESVASFIPIIRDPIHMRLAVVGTVVFGAVTGLTGSAISVRRYLRV
ncbi:MAG: permease-like cell division protein FtsX [Firmicutes bacterium]|nr:permease-like cell division protein FtsX [Bacillota bacterium]